MFIPCHFLLFFVFLSQPQQQQPQQQGQQQPGRPSSGPQAKKSSGGPKSGKPNSDSAKPQYPYATLAKYDYSPDPESLQGGSTRELPLKRDDPVLVLGPERPDGFCEAKVNGKQGLVPACFLEVCVCVCV